MDKARTPIIVALLLLALAVLGGAIYSFREPKGNEGVNLLRQERNTNPLPSLEAKRKDNAPPGRGAALPSWPPAIRKSAGSIEIVYPAGGELLQTGVNYLIRWKSRAIGSGAVMRIGYRSANAPGEATGQIVRTTNVGSASWRTPLFIDSAEVPGGSCTKGKEVRQEYIVDVIWVSSDGSYLAYGASKPFTIEGPCGPLP